MFEKLGIEDPLIEDYDEVEDAYKIRASREEYEKECADLVRKIAERDDFAKLLKIANPEKIAGVRQVIAEFDQHIEECERIVAMSYDIYQQRLDLWKHRTKLSAVTKLIKPELLKYVAEHNPEKLEVLEAILSGDDKTH